MELEIRGQNIRVGDRLHEQVERQMNFALGQFEYLDFRGNRAFGRYQRSQGGHR